MKDAMPHELFTSCGIGRTDLFWNCRKEQITVQLNCGISLSRIHYLKRHYCSHTIDSLQLTFLEGHVFLSLTIKGWVLNTSINKEEQVLFDLGWLYLYTTFRNLVRTQG